jgi:hypothetical protein
VANPNFAPMYATRKVKTDRRDARALAEACLLGAYCPAHRLSDAQRCGIGSWGGQRPSLGDYVTATTRGARCRRVLMLPILILSLFLFPGQFPLGQRAVSFGGVRFSLGKKARSADIAIRDPFSLQYVPGA